MSGNDAAYMRRWRRDHPDLYRRSQLAGHARAKALRRLGRMYPLTLLGLLDEERAKVGLPPVGTESNVPKSRRSA